ncbi:MAG TPA: N-acetylglucosamine-6-phosphate deacetylase [Candidatus Baltobacteraceae bacterium]|nr:N-acetylglucosamine-6-phosphate deacetylase [Candidatus Baltobacteraceae bacterium]
MSDSYILGPARIALGDGTLTHGRLAVERGRIARILPEDGPSDLHLPDGAMIAPGLIDVHTNGADEFLFNRDQGNAVEVAARAYARQGATGFVAGIMTAPWESMMHAAAEVSEAACQLEEAGTPIGARCLGIHFEGPFLNPKFRRVHRAEWIVPATTERAREMVEACKGALVIVTMAPEMDGVDDIARFFFDQGIVCAAGHTAAHYRDGMLAIGLGFRTLTHAFNAMPPLDHRDPSILAAFIQESRTTVQLICDGYHVSPPMVDLLYRTLHDRLVLATDNMPPAGSGYRIEGGVVRSEDGTIAGSALLMDQAVRNLMAYADIPFATAIVNATRSPARLLNLDRELGTLEAGKRADISIWSDEYEVIATIVGGIPVYGGAHLYRATRANA